MKTCQVFMYFFIFAIYNAKINSEIFSGFIFVLSSQGRDFVFYFTRHADSS